MSMKKIYPKRLNIPVTSGVKAWVREQSGGDGFMADFSRDLLARGIKDYKIHNPQKKPATLVIDTEE